MANVNEIYNAATAIVVALMRQDNLNTQIQQVIASNIDASVSPQTADEWMKIILQKIQSLGVNWQNGVTQEVLQRVCLDWLRAAVPEAAQIVQSRQGGLIGGGGANLIGGAKTGFDYSAITGSGSGGSAATMIGQDSIYDTSPGAPQQPASPPPEVTITAHSAPQQQASASHQASGLKVVSGEYTSNMTLIGQPNSLLRSQDLDWLDAFDSVKFNVDPFGLDGMKSLGRAAFSPGYTGIRRARSSGDNKQSDTCYRLDLVSSRPYNTPIEVLMDFYQSCPNEILKTLWYAQIEYDQFVTFDLPEWSYKTIRNIFNQFFPNDGDFKQRTEVWERFYNAFGTIPNNAAGPVVDYLIKRFGSHVARFNRSVIAPETCIYIETMKDIEALATPILTTRIREDVNWDATIAAGLADAADPFLNPQAPIDGSINTELMPYCRSYRANLPTASLTKLLTAGESDASVKEAIDAAAKYKTLVKIRRNIIATNLIPSGHLTKVPDDYFVRSDQEDAFWKTFEFTNPSPTAIRQNEFVFAIPCTATPEDAMYAYEFSSLMGNATQPSLISSKRDISGMILKGRIDY